MPFLAVDLTNVDGLRETDDLPRGTIHVFRLQFLRGACCYAHFRLLNSGLDVARISLLLRFDSDFADIFEVRGTKRAQKGELLPGKIDGDAAVVEYRGLDGLIRRTRLEFSPKPTSFVPGEALFQLRLDPKEETSISATVSCERGAGHKVADSFPSAFAGLEREATRVGIDRCHITTCSESFNAWLTRSSADLRMLMEGNPEGPYPYAGVPWFNTIFGRDGIITALQCLWLAPHISEGHGLQERSFCCCERVWVSMRVRTIATFVFTDRYSPRTSNKFASRICAWETRAVISSFGVMGQASPPWRSCGNAATWKLLLPAEARLDRGWSR